MWILGLPGSWGCRGSWVCRDTWGCRDSWVCQDSWVCWDSWVCQDSAGLRRQTFRLLSVSTKLDGVKKACWVLALHPFSVSTEFDGVFMACRVQALHPFSVSTEFDGMKKACLAQTIHPITPSAISDGTPAIYKKTSGPRYPQCRKQDFLPSVTNQFTISDQFRNFPKLLSSRLVP